MRMSLDRTLSYQMLNDPSDNYVINIDAIETETSVIKPPSWNNVASVIHVNQQDVNAQTPLFYDTCVICLDPLVDISRNNPLFTCSFCRATICHMSCMNHWLQYKSTCPCCNISFDHTVMDVQSIVNQRDVLLKEYHVLVQRNKFLTGACIFMLTTSTFSHWALLSAMGLK